MSENSRQAPVMSGLTPGAVLRQAREAAGLTHTAVGEALHLTVHYIKALENDEYHKLPGLIFVKGYIRSYARFLKLDAETLVANCDQQIQSMPQIKNQTLAGNYTRKRNDAAIVWALAGTLIVVVGIGVLWWIFGSNTEQTQTTTIVQPQTAVQMPVQSTAPTLAAEASASEQEVAVTTPDASAGGLPLESAYQEGANATATALPSAVTPATSPAGTSSAIAPDGGPVISLAPGGGRQISLVKDGSDQMQLSFGSNSWVEITDGLNNRLYAEMLRSGDVLQVKGRAPFVVLLGDARQVKASFNSQAIDVSSNVRSDNTARLSLGGTVAATQPPAAPGVVR